MRGTTKTSCQAAQRPKSRLHGAGGRGLVPMGGGWTRPWRAARQGGRRERKPTRPREKRKERPLHLHGNGGGRCGRLPIVHLPSQKLPATQLSQMSNQYYSSREATHSLTRCRTQGKKERESFITLGPWPMMPICSFRKPRICGVRFCCGALLSFFHCRL